MRDRLDNFDYNLEKYHGGYLHLGDQIVTIYRSGKYIIPGVKSFDKLLPLYDEMKLSLSQFLDVTIIRPPEIRNIVASDQLNTVQNLHDLCIRMFEIGVSPDYEPETFPGLILKLKCGTINLFSSGKYILLGAKSENELVNLKRQFIELLDSLG